LSKVGNCFLFQNRVIFFILLPSFFFFFYTTTNANLLSSFSFFFHSNFTKKKKMQSDIHYNYYSNNNQPLPPATPQNRTLRGPRPLDQQQQQEQRNISTWPSKFPKRPPRMPIMVTVPSKSKFIPPAGPAIPYVYPPPASIEREGSKTEILLDEEEEEVPNILPCPAPSSSTKTIDEELEEEAIVPTPSPPPRSFAPKKKLPPRPTTRTPPTFTKKPIRYYSTDDEEEDESDDIDDDEMLQEFKLSRKKSVHDITISDDDEDDDEGDDDEEESPVEQTAPISNNKFTSTRQADLPPTPPVSTPINYHKPTPPLPTATKNNDLPPIPTIFAPGYSSDEDDNEIPPIPTICVPGGFSDDEDDTVKNKRKEKKKVDSIYNSIYFGIRCGGCDDPLSGQAITTSGKHWHTHCFKCQACHQDLEHIAFYEMKGLPYCALDYHELFSPRCDFCKTPIEEHSISALGKTYHAGHFFCRECGKPFDADSNFLEHEGHAYCEKDYYKQFGKSCKGCEELITGDFLVALDGEWHKECFVCADCGGAFTSSTFLIKGGKPYCEEHYHKQSSHLLKKNNNNNSLPPMTTSKKTTASPFISLPRTSLNKLPDILPILEDKSNTKNSEEPERSCHKCDKVIQGRFLSAFGYDYHPLHFQCSQCNKLLSAKVTGKLSE
jgi:hypothetical protein